MKPFGPTRTDPKRLGHGAAAFEQLRTYSTSPVPGSGHRGRRALVGVLAISAVVVAASLAFSNMRSRGQKVTIVPVAAAQPLMLYVANWSESTVMGYPLGGPYGSPRVTLSTDVNEPQGLLFDRAGDLWVANAGSLDEYARDKLPKPSPTPETVIQGGSSFAGMAWDSSGDLWVDDYGDNTVDEYANSQLTRSGTPTAKVTLSGNDLSKPFGLTFDRAGDLWIGNEGNGRVLEYTKSQLTRSGSPTPKVDYTRWRLQPLRKTSSSTPRATCGRPQDSLPYWLTTPRASSPRPGRPQRSPSSRSPCPP